MPLRILAGCLVFLTLFVYLHSDYVYVSVLTRSQGLTWTSIGGVNDTEISNLSNYSFNQDNATTTNNSSNGNGSVSQLSEGCLTRTETYVSTIWIFNCTKDTSVTDFWYLGNGYNQSDDTCKSSLATYLSSMCNIWTNYSNGNESRQDHLNTSEVRCILPESYSVNTTIHQYNDTELESRGQKYHQLFPLQHTCSLVEALAFDVIQNYVYISRLCWNIAQIIALLCIVTVSLVVWIRYQYCGKTPCMCLLPPNVSVVPTCQDVIVETNVNQPEEDNTSLNSPVEPEESSEITPILSASAKPCIQKPSVPPKPPTVSSQFKVMHALNKPCMLPKPPPKPAPLQSPKSDVFTFDDQDIQKHKEEMSQQQVKPKRIPVLARPPTTTTLTRTTDAPRLPPPPRQATFSPRAPTMIPWDRKSQMSPVEYSSWRQQAESLPAELDPWNVNPNRWL
ncbi:Ja36 [Japanese cytomegalovirus]|nr:Ja36 [Japanese cytomegalovirus]